MIDQPDSPSLPSEPIGNSSGLVTIVTAFDANYSPFFSTVLASLADHVNPQRQYEILVLEDSVPDAEKGLHRLVLEPYPNISIQFIDMSQSFQRTEATHVHFTKSTFSRLKLPALLPGHRKVLYLDPDTVVLGDVGVLFDTDVSNRYCAATLDYVIKYIRAIGMHVLPKFGGVSIEQYLREDLALSEPALENYFNAGVAVLNLEKIRNDGVDQRMLELYRARPYYLVDQDILNKAFDGQVVHVDPRWNVIAQPISEMRRMPEHFVRSHEESRRAPFIIHFAGSHLKPWNNPNVDFAEQFWKYCRLTPHYERILTSCIRQQLPSVREILVPSPIATHSSEALPGTPSSAGTCFKAAFSHWLLQTSPPLWRGCRWFYQRFFKPLNATTSGFPETAIPQRTSRLPGETP